MAQEIHVEGPTRLVSVGKSPTFDDVCLRAFEADNLRPKYVDLSYRLGGAGDFKFTTEIPEIMKSRIQINFLAKTIRQAIALTRRLGVEHIWFDSLCILQNSRADWAHESTKIRAIYEYSYCTIAAIDSEDANGGQFQSRTFLGRLTCRLGVKIKRTKCLREPIHILRPGHLYPRDKGVGFSTKGPVAKGFIHGMPRNALGVQ